jgi:hypothetical protein
VRIIDRPRLILDIFGQHAAPARDSSGRAGPVPVFSPADRGARRARAAGGRLGGRARGSARTRRDPA